VTIAASRIHVLAAPVADQIAAGEVVERPASVVKELVENALDAGARTIEVSVEDGGRALIRVADDGSGMGRDDAVLALERHATSKITTAADLVGVASFGFRGEALPAIASVSEFTIETAPEDGAGTIVRGSGGVVLHVGDVARRQGTTVQVHRLFHNTPARRKFLKGARSEWRAISETVGQIAVLRRDVHFTVRHDGRIALDLPAAPSLRARLAALWGNEAIGRLVDVDDVSGVLHLRGLVERPADVGTRTRRVLLVVNGRLVRDAGLVRAAEAAYRSTLPAGLRPSLVLDLTLPAGDVDVNVHPAKAEVRLHERWPTERAVEHLVRRALGTFDAAAGVGWRTWSPGGAAPSPHVGATDDAVAPHVIAPWMLRVQSGAADDGLFAGHGDAHQTAVSVPGERTSGAATPDAVTGFVASTAHGGGASAQPIDVQVADAPATRTARAEEIVVPPLLQLRRMYLMFEHEEGVVLIDQHAAHERVLYERFLGQLTGGAMPSQRLLFPLTLHLSAAEADAFEASAATFAALGFEVEAFGGHTLLVQAVPMPHPRFDAEWCLRETLAALAGDRAPSDAARHERLAATVACKAAVKAGDALSPAEMRALYLDLARTTLPANDVHGRAVIVRLGWDELDRRFGRG
jgi:DNA mismatch repair protein MutL